MKKLIFILPVFLMTSCIKKIVENTLGEVKDRQCECTYTATGKTEKKESTTIKNKNMFAIRQTKQSQQKHVYHSSNETK